MSVVRIRPHLLFDEGWETVSFETFVAGWLRKSGVSVRDGVAAPPFWMFRLDQRFPQSFVARFGRDRWFPAPFQTNEDAYAAACKSLGKEIIEAEPWMANLTDYARQVAVLKRPGSVSAKSLRRVRNRRMWIMGVASATGQVTSVPHEGLTDLLAHANNTWSRYQRFCTERAGLSYKGLSLAFSTIEQPEAIGGYNAPDLCGARVSCDVAGLDLVSADLRRCDLSQARRLESASTAQAWFDDGTKFPVGFDPAAHGMIMGAPVGEPVEPLDLPVNIDIRDPQGQRSDLD